MSNPRFQSRFGDSDLLNPMGRSQEEAPPKPTTFEVLTKLLVPALALAAVIVAQLQQQRLLSWVLLGILLLFLGIGFFPSLRRQTRECVENWRDKRLARRVFPQFRTFVRRFGEYVSPQRGDTLHEIALGELCSRNHANFGKLGFPPVQLFNGFWYYLRLRTESLAASPSNLVTSIAEFNDLVSSYNNSCVSMVFDRFPAELQPMLTPNARSKLESFREQFALFLSNYSEFLKGLDESFSKPRIEPWGFSRPGPLER